MMALEVNMKESKKIKKITIRMHEDLQKEMRIAAIMRNVSLNLLIHRALYYYLRIDKEKKPLCD